MRTKRAKATKTIRKTHKTLHNGNGTHKAIEARDAVLDAVSEARERFGDIEKDTIKYAKQNPIRTMGFSMLAGLVIAQLLHLHR